MTVGDAIRSMLAKMQGSGQVSPAEVHAMVKAGEAVLLDVREAPELASGMAEGARWIATSEIQRNSEAWRTLVAELPKDKPVFVYCAAGMRAGGVAGLLSRQGFRTGNLGGFSDWVGAGLPVVRRG